MGRGKGVTYRSAIQNIFIALKSALVELLKNCVTSDKFHLSRPQSPQMYEGAGWIEPHSGIFRHPTTALSVRDRGKNIAWSWQDSSCESRLVHNGGLGSSSQSLSFGLCPMGPIRPPWHCCDASE